MHEVQEPKKPLYYYYGVALLILMCFNLLAMPYMAEKQVKNIDYGTFMTMTDDKDIGRVEIQSNQIIFTDKAEKNIYKTGEQSDNIHRQGGKEHLQDRTAQRPGARRPPARSRR